MSVQPYCEILEDLVFAHGYHQIGHQQAAPDIPLDGVRLHVHTADELHLEIIPAASSCQLKMSTSS